MSSAPPLVVTLDLENHRTDRHDRRYLANSERILDFLHEIAVRATIFVVGEIVSEASAVLRRAADEGHELALHSATHTPLTELSPAALLSPLGDARKQLEDVSGTEVSGFRAPIFSLTTGSLWATEVLLETGFKYSSSVLPAANPLFGFEGAPLTSFRWPCGIVEFPAPLCHLGPLTLPFTGGIYLRYLPQFLFATWLRRLPVATVRWAYLHPYDIDRDEPYYHFPGTTRPQSLLLWRRRGGTLKRLRKLVDLHDGRTRTFAATLAGLAPTRLPTFSPTAVTSA